ncbi:MAG TPA: ABC transporter permease [Anaerolineae bacterium]|nr:ABC transporter permease [Anaerolineae bacterium]HNU03790.1 ABC transporter permease [Anaerolineae bacterium]
MTTYIVRRILISLPIILVITVIVFLLANMMPGDAVMAMISSDSPMEADLIKLRQGQLGLDLPLYEQYGRWLGNLLKGSLGYSFQTGEPVGQMILTRIPATLELMGLSLLISVILGVFLGTISAMKQYSPMDYGLTLFGFTGISIPDFFLGMILIFIFALKLGWFPTSGMVTAGTEFSWSDNLRHLFLPALALALVRTSVFMRYTRASVLEVINEDYVRTARAKGMTERVVTVRHILRNALIPVITVIGINLTVLFAGSVIIETIFQWPGIGMMFINAIALRDSPVIMGYVLISAFVVLLANLVTDVTYSFADPRIRYE